MNLIEMLASNASQSPQHDALIFLNEQGEEASRYTWSQLSRAVANLSEQIKAHYLPGQTAVMVFDPEPRFTLTFLACLAAGVTCLPLPPMVANRARYQMDQLHDLCRDSDAAVLFSAGESLIQLKTLCSELTPKLWPIPNIEELVGHACLPTVDPDGLAALLYTSGTTRAAKGVRIRHRHLQYNARTCCEAWQVVASSVLISWMPNHHSFGMIYNQLLPLFSGCTLVAMAPSTFAGRPDLWLRAVDRYRASHGAAATFGYQHCCDRLDPKTLCDLDLSCWQVGLISAEPIHRRVCDDFQTAFSPLGLPAHFFCALYGLSECGPITSMPAQVPSIFLNKLRTPRSLGLACVGKPLNGSQVRIVDPHTRLPLGQGEQGEVWLSGPSLMDGYHRRDQDNRAVFSSLPGEQGRYFRSGDEGIQTPVGLYITGRIKEIIIIRGKNYYPQDIEWVASASHALLGVGAAFEAEQGGLVLVLESETVQVSDRYREAARNAETALAGQLGIRPQQIVLVAKDEIPKTSSGKIRRSCCQALQQFTVLYEHSNTRELALTNGSILDQVKCLIAVELNLQPHEIEVQAPLSDYQFDSMAIMELSAAIGDISGATFHPSLFFKCESLAELVLLLEERHD